MRDLLRDFHNAVRDALPDFDLDQDRDTLEAMMKEINSDDERETQAEWDAMIARRAARLKKNKLN